LRGVPYLNKPQLFFWSVAVASDAGGEMTEWTVVAARRQAFLAGGIVVPLGVGTILVVEGARYPDSRGSSTSGSSRPRRAL
jgi:hypothetical protein